MFISQLNAYFVIIIIKLPTDVTTINFVEELYFRGNNKFRLVIFVHLLE